LAKSSASSNDPCVVFPADAKIAAEWPPAAQNMPGCSLAMSSAPNPPIESPPMAIRSGSACSRRIAFGMTSRVTYVPHRPSRRSCQ
jgi:hypothetical protein